MQLYICVQLYAYDVFIAADVKRLKISNEC